MRLVCLVLCACTNSVMPTPPLGGALTVKGTVTDLRSGSAIAGTAMVSVAGLEPSQNVSVSGANFTLTDVPENSAFQILASAPPTDHATYSPSTVVVADDLSGVVAYTVPEMYLSQLASGFGVTPNAANGIVFLQLVDSSGMPKSGVAGSNLALNGVTSSPHFLDASGNPSTATSTSASGWVVYFDVPPGALTLGQAAGATVTLAMDASPVAAGTVTIANVVVTSGAPPPLPTNVSFANQVVPIFTARGCINCHSGGGIGKNLGNLALDGGVNHVYGQLVTSQYPLRVVLSAPETSKVLTMPSYENPPDAHPNVTFTGPQDPDYEKLLVWIREGAKNN